MNNRFSIQPFGLFSDFNARKRDLWKPLLLVVLFIAASAFLFYNAVRFDLPLGFAGMYTLMAEQISSNGFLLPESTPFYGPGGLPFAYPPLGFYVMALVTRVLDVSSITYLRYIPPLFSLLSLIPLCLLVEKMTSSFWAAFFSTAFAAFSPTFYYTHTWSAGIVRGLAFFLMLGGFYCFQRALEEDGLLFKILTGVFFGLTSLTHLFYALFFAVWLACFGIASFNRRALAAWITIFFTAALLTAPWVYVMTSRYGIQVFKFAFVSHDNSAFLSVVSQGRMDILLDWLGAKFLGVPVPWLAFVLSGMAVVYLIYKRQYGIPFVFLVLIFALSPEGDRFVVLLVSMLVGVSVAAAGDLFKSQWLRFALIGCVALAVMQMGDMGIREILRTIPVFRGSAFDVADYVEENIPLNSRYLFVAGQAEAEWFPYLLKREPFVSKWGSEWLGTYDEQRILQGNLAYCKDGQSLQCLKDLDLEVMPDDIIITKNEQKKLAYELEASGACQRIAILGAYVIWHAGCLMQ